jgi:hypothetical protein
MGKANVVPVFVTNWGGGGIKDTLGKGGKGGKVGRIAKAAAKVAPLASRAAIPLSAGAAAAGIGGLAYYYRNKPALKQSRNPAARNSAGAVPAPGFGNAGIHRVADPVKPKQVYGPPAPGPYVKAAAEQAGKAAAHWSNTRPINLNVNIDGKPIAAAVAREAKRDKARR